ncbi:hypothetical protein, variant [Spizellomyces punctatus DAOM BR117]|nr:hypothetical protein, variant [Spizellomyces punctatus DAOM BR117]KNC99354.1 hypothetical protein, variant [Spizellomyces punctatus DAOM BR117]|eukprot:XP_016607394.1 hypothetical protein, variant [Spizellomyces punctatus DAOM BR117]
MGETSNNSSPILSLYKSTATLPSFSASHIFPNEGGARVLLVSTVRDLDRNTRTRLFTELAVTDDGKNIQEGFSSEVADGTDLLIGMKDGKRWVVLKSVPDKEKGNNGKRRFVQIWQSGRIVKSIEVTEKHGDFYTDDTFGSIALSSTESTVAYVAERKLPDLKGPDKFKFKPDWGEKFTKKAAPAIVLCNLDTEEITVVKDQEDLAVGQVLFGPNDDSLIFWGVKTHPRQYGILFCPNRLSGIYQTGIKGENLIRISAEDESARSPRFDSARKTLFYISNPIGGPHFPCGELISYSFADKSRRIVLPEVEKPEPTDFPGLFVDRFAPDAVVGTGDAQWIITHTNWRSRKTVIAVHASTGKVIDLCPNVETGSWTLLGVKENWVVAVRSDPGTPHEVHIGRLQFTATSASITLHLAHSPSPPVEPLIWRTITYDSRSPILEAILLLPSSTQSKTVVKGEKPPLLVYPHGGPHGAFTSEFSIYNYCLVQLGIGIILVNYRGSIGFGKDGVDCLVGRVGDMEVEDTQFVAEQVRTSGEVDADRVAIWGGSHGGFVSAWLIGKYPDYYKACVLRNPVINMGSNLAQSDIPDWSLAEAGITYNLAQPPLTTPEIYSKIWPKSPISVAQHVKTPSLLMLGENDRRVPPYEGMNWYYYLKGRGGVDIRVMTYPDNGHALDGVEAERFGFEAIAEFLVEFIGIK